MNAALGSAAYGIPYGKLLELSGEKHGGKTALSTVLAGMAQGDNAACGYIDVEQSRDGAWAFKLGYDLDSAVKVYPKLIQDSPKARPRLQCAEELFAEAEEGMHILNAAGHKKQFWMLDSIAMLQTGMSIEAGPDGRNMRTKLDRSMFLSDALPRWAGLAASYNALIVLINQVRTKPGVMFGDPTYTPGGSALGHACSIQARVRRKGSGVLRKNGMVIGIVGVVTNTKNKAGQGSVQGAKAAFKILWNRKVAKIEFMEAKEAEDAMNENKRENA
jgi:recombination protein RecA